VHVPGRSRAVPIGGTCAFFFLSLLLPAPARAAREWYDYYLAARDRLIPAGRCAEAIKELDEAIRIKPSSGLNEQTYGLQFIDYLPYYQRGRCRVQEEDYAHALLDFKTEEERGPVKKSSEYKELLRLRADAQSQEQARVTRGIRDDAQRLLREAADLVRKKSYDEALTKLAQAEVAAKGLDPEILRQVTEARDKIRVTQEELQLSASRAQRIEQRLAEAGRLLDEGKATDAVVAFDDVLKLDAQNARALEGKKAAQERILAATTRQGRAESFRAGKALFEAGQYEAALPPLTDAAADRQNQQARELLEKARQIVEGMRKQKEIQAQIDRLMGRGERLLQEGQFPEAQVAFEGVLRLDTGHARAKERLSVAERRTGEALFARWFPNEGPGLSFFEPRGQDVDGDRTTTETPSRTASVAGVATDDRGVDRVEFHLGGKLIAEQRPLPSLDAVASSRLLNFQREFPLEPGRNDLVVTAFDGAGLSRTQTFEITRRLRFYESKLFLPAALAGALGMIGAGFGLQRARRQRARRRRFNPYIAGAPVLEDQMFFGREKLTARILNVLHHNSLMITGERRIGKTTFLYHLKKVLLADELSDYRFFPVFVDLQGVPEQGFFHALMGEIVDSLAFTPATRSALRYTPDVEPYDGRDFSHDLQRVLEELKTRTDKKVKLALLIDEVDVLNEYSERVNQRLRGIFMKTFSENLVAVMSGVGIKRSWKSEVSPWYNFFDEIEITAFTREEAEALIRTPVGSVFRYEPEAVEKILELSGQKPYLVQKLCIHAVNHMLEEGRTTIRVSDVEAARATASHEASAEETEPTGVHASA
jgi:tetratricopeptide (TPR) repeat protein